MKEDLLLSHQCSIKYKYTYTITYVLFESLLLMTRYFLCVLLLFCCCPSIGILFLISEFGPLQNNLSLAFRWIYKVIPKLSSFLVVLTPMPRLWLAGEWICWMLLDVIVTVWKNCTFHSTDVIMTIRCPKNRYSEAYSLLKWYSLFFLFLGFFPSLLFCNKLDCGSSSCTGFFIGFGSEVLSMIMECCSTTWMLIKSPLLNESGQPRIWNTQREWGHYVPDFCFKTKGPFF
jgi:hypothetical protein